jgi:hypothetical protein
MEDFTMFRRSHHSSSALLMAAWLLLPPLGGGASLAEYALMGRVEAPTALAIVTTDPVASTGSVTPEQALHGFSASQPEPWTASDDAPAVAFTAERALLNH